MLFLVAIALVSSLVNAMVVNTTNGPILGHPAPNVSSVVEFLGIPYAQPTYGRPAIRAAREAI